MPFNEGEDQKIYQDEEFEDLNAEETEDDEDINAEADSPSTSSDDPNKYSNTLAVVTPSVATVAIATAVNGGAIEAPPLVADNKLQLTNEPIEEKKPLVFDDSRRLFQRLWTDEDEIRLLQGFLDYTSERGSQNSFYHQDTAPFYDQIKSRLELNFNKSQLVEKLRRLKKKYRNVVNRMTSGKEVYFKSPHDQATFDISRKIWSGGVSSAGGVDEAGVEIEDQKPALHSEINNEINNGTRVSNSEKVPTSRKRSRKKVAEDNLPNASNCQENSSIPTVIEDTVRSCLSPLVKELLHCATNGPCNLGGLGGGMALNSLPLNFASSSSMNFSSGEVLDERWRKQQILELEVYSKRIELVQDQIKSALEELRSMGS